MNIYKFLLSLLTLTFVTISVYANEVSCNVSFNNTSINFRQYCPSEDKDCSVEFKNAVEIAKDGGHFIYFPEGKYNISTFERLAAGERFCSIALIGENWSRSKILTSSLNFSQFKHSYIHNLSIEGIESQLSPDFLVRFGVDPVNKIDKVTIDKVIFRNSGQDLINIVGAREVSITSSHFENAGYMNIRLNPDSCNNSDPNCDKREHGNAITLKNVGDLTVGDIRPVRIENNYFTQIRRVGIMALENSHNIIATRNTFNLLSKSQPSTLYGLRGGACFYQLVSPMKMLPFLIILVMTTM